MYATRDEVKFILERYDSQTRAALALKVETWLAKFQESGFEKDYRTNAFKYRLTLNWCPLLENGECSVYDHRPLECRLFNAKGDPKGCEDDALRPKQQFADTPEIIDVAMRRQLLRLKEEQSLEYDHLGILLAEELFGKRFTTKARMWIIRRNGEFLRADFGDEALTSKGVADK